MDGQHIVNVKNKKCFDVKGGKDAEGQTIWVWRKHNGLNQRWRIVYLDKKDDDRTKGMNKDFGMEINRPFFLQSRMPRKRVVRTNSNNVTIQTIAVNRKNL
jgi:hypothetical protein